MSVRRRNEGNLGAMPAGRPDRARSWPRSPPRATLRPEVDLEPGPVAAVEVDGVLDRPAVLGKGGAANADRRRARASAQVASVRRPRAWSARSPRAHAPDGCRRSPPSGRTATAWPGRGRPGRDTRSRERTTSPAAAAPRRRTGSGAAATRAGRRRSPRAVAHFGVEVSGQLQVRAPVRPARSPEPASVPRTRPAAAAYGRREVARRKCPSPGRRYTSPAPHQQLHRLAGGHARKPELVGDRPLAGKPRVGRELPIGDLLRQLVGGLAVARYRAGSDPRGWMRPSCSIYTTCQDARRARIVSGMRIAAMVVAATGLVPSPSPCGSEARRARCEPTPYAAPDVIGMRLDRGHVAAAPGRRCAHRRAAREAGRPPGRVAQIRGVGFDGYYTRDSDLVLRVGR